MTTTDHLIHLAGYPAHLRAQVQQLIADGRLGEWLLRRHPETHPVRTDRALYAYVDGIKNDYLRNAGPLAKVAYDGKLQSVRKALGTHTRIAHVQGSKLKTRREIHVATLFREAPPAFLKMIVVHELAHLKESEHDKAFYQLCCHMEADYHQLEFEVRAYLCHLAAGGAALWGGMPGPSSGPAVAA